MDNLLLALPGWPFYQHVHAHDAGPSAAALSPRAPDGSPAPAPPNPLAMCHLSAGLCSALGFDTVLEPWNGPNLDRWVRVDSLVARWAAIGVWWIASGVYA